MRRLACVIGLALFTCGCFKQDTPKPTMPIAEPDDGALVRVQGSANPLPPSYFSGTGTYARTAGTSTYARLSGTGTYANVAGAVSQAGYISSALRTLYGSWQQPATPSNGNDIAIYRWVTNWVATHAAAGGVDANPKFTNRIEVGMAASTNTYYDVSNAVVVGTANDLSNSCYLTISGDSNTVALSDNVNVFGDSNAVFNMPFVTISGIGNVVAYNGAYDYGYYQNLLVFGDGNGVTDSGHCAIFGDSNVLDAYCDSSLVVGDGNNLTAAERVLVAGADIDLASSQNMLVVGVGHRISGISGPGFVVGTSCAMTGGYMSAAFGLRANVVHEGAWVIKGDTDNATFVSDTNSQFKAKFGNGYKFQGGTTEVAAVSVKAANCNWGGFGTTNIRHTVQTVTGGIVTVTLADSGRQFVTTGKTTFSLPSVDATSLGAWYGFIARSTNVVIIDAADTDVIDNSGTVTNTYTSDASAFKSANVILGEATWWHVTHGRGTWTAGTGP